MEKTNRPHAPRPVSPQYGWRDPRTVETALGRAEGGARGAEPGRGSAMPVEIGGAVIYQKRFDNGDVHYRHDPRDRASLRWHVSVGLFVALMLLLAFGPRLWVRHSGYRQAELTAKVNRLVAVRDQLKYEKGRREGLARVAELAQELGLRQTEENSYMWFTPQPGEEELEHAVVRLFDPVE